MFGYYVDLALRALRANPVLTALMVLAIAVGIGASMTTLTVMHVLSGDPLPGKSEQIFYPQLYHMPKAPGPHAEPTDMMDYRSAMDLWSAKRADRQTLVVESAVTVLDPAAARPPELQVMLATTADFFPMFDVPFRHGGAWDADAEESRERVAVISAELNDRLFGGENSVGRTLRVRDADLRIVGVLAPWRPLMRFWYVVAGNFANGDTASYYVGPEDVFMPFQTALEVNDGYFQQFTCWGGMPEREGHLVDAPCSWIGVWVELGSAAKVADYQRFLDGYAAEQAASGRVGGAITRLRSLMQWLDYNHVVPRNARLQSWLAFAFLAICLFNTIGLLLAKFLRRAGQIGVRRALGATRRDIFLQCLVEAGLIGLVGGALGLLLTLGGLWVIRRQPIEYADLITLDLPMFLTTFALAIAASLLAGAIPALRASRVAPALQLKTL